MNIRSRITLRFILIDAIIILLASVLIYVFSADYREEDFLDKLHNKASNTAKLLIEVDEVSTELLLKLERDNPVSLKNEKIIVYDYMDKIIFSTDEKHIIHIDKELLNRIRLEQQITFKQDQYEGIGFLYKGQYDRFVVIAAATDVYGLNKLHNLSNILLIVFVFSILIVSIAGWFFAGQALKPISKVIEQVNEISITSLNLRVDDGNGQDEIARLAQTFNKMIERLEASFKVQKNFITNASHELRTPLTSITGQLEVTLQNERSVDIYKKTIISVLEDIKNLNNLANRLLLLAKTSEERKVIFTTLRIDELIWQTREDIVRHNRTYTINIDFDQNLNEESDLTIKGDEQLLKTAITNLIENGCKYSDNRAIDILIGCDIRNLTILFSDKGIGIQPEDMANIFEPFYRGVNVQEIKGHGIGLPMVRSIIKIHNGTLDVKSSPGKGTDISISFPLA